MHNISMWKYVLSQAAVFSQDIYNVQRVLFEMIGIFRRNEYFPIFWKSATDT